MSAQGRNEREDCGEMLLIGLLYKACFSLLSYITQKHLPRDVNYQNLHIVSSFSLPLPHLLSRMAPWPREVTDSDSIPGAQQGLSIIQLPGCYLLLLQAFP